MDRGDRFRYRKMEAINMKAINMDDMKTKVAETVLNELSAEIKDFPHKLKTYLWPAMRVCLESYGLTRQQADAAIDGWATKHWRAEK
jgi:hypothetical protein